MASQPVCLFAFTLLWSGCLLSDWKSAERSERERQRDISVNSTATGSDEPSPRAGGEHASEPAAGTTAGAGSYARAGAAGRAHSGGAGTRTTAGSAGRGAADGGTTGQRAESGAGAAGARSNGTGTGGLGAAGANAGGQAGCGDTANDPSNCGECGHDCHASAALASCVDGACMRACTPQFADCNGDLGFGSSGDGCETSVQSDLQNCGGCDVRCEGFWGVVPVCENKRCGEIRMLIGRPEIASAELHGGSTGGEPFEQICGRNAVLVGLDFATNGDALYGAGAVCAESLLSGKPGMLMALWGARTTYPLVGNRAMPPGTLSHVECPSGAAITSVSGSTWLFGSIPSLAIRHLVLTCSQAWFDERDQLQWSPGGLLRVGVQATETVDTFTDTCPAGHVMVGIAGRAGWVVDGLSTFCSPLTLHRETPASAAGSEP